MEMGDKHRIDVQFTVRLIWRLMTTQMNDPIPQQRIGDYPLPVHLDQNGSVAHVG
jgi:hypothetical protein